MWTLSSPTRDRTQGPCSWNHGVLKHWTSRQVPPSKLLSFASQRKVCQGNCMHHRLTALSHTEHTRVTLRLGEGGQVVSPQSNPCACPQTGTTARGPRGRPSRLLTAPGVGTGGQGSHTLGSLPLGVTFPGSSGELWGQGLSLLMASRYRSVAAGRARPARPPYC